MCLSCMLDFKIHAKRLIMQKKAKMQKKKKCKKKGKNFYYGSHRLWVKALFYRILQYFGIINKLFRLRINRLQKNRTIPTAIHCDHIS